MFNKLSGSKTVNTVWILEDLWHQYVGELPSTIRFCFFIFDSHSPIPFPPFVGPMPPEVADLAELKQIRLNKTTTSSQVLRVDNLFPGKRLTCVGKGNAWFFLQKPTEKSPSHCFSELLSCAEMRPTHNTANQSMLLESDKHIRHTFSR